jgi:hypothetical protein
LHWTFFNYSAFLFIHSISQPGKFQSDQPGKDGSQAESDENYYSRKAPGFDSQFT